MIIITDTIERVYQSYIPHFKRLESASIGGSDMSDFFESFNDFCETHKIDSAESLRAYGIDIQKHILAGLCDIVSEDSRFVVIIPVTNKKKFYDFMCHLDDSDPRISESEIEKGLNRTAWFLGQDRIVLYFVNTFGHTYALILSDMDLLGRAIRDINSNFFYHVDNDSFRTHVASTISGFKRNSGVGAVCYFQEPIIDTLHDCSLSVFAKANRLDFELNSALDTGKYKIIDTLCASVSGDIIFGKASNDNCLLFDIKDSDIKSYLNLYLPELKSGSREPENIWEEILQRLMYCDSLKELMVSVPRYRYGLPVVAAGICGDRDAFEKIVFNIQRKKRKERDLKILSAAFSELPDEDKKKDYMFPSLLIQHGLLSEEENVFWDKYTFQFGEKMKDGDTSVFVEAIMNDDIQKEDFTENSEYFTFVGDKKCLYLLPPITDNDIRYRIHESEGLDPNVLFSNDYRLCSFLENDVLWIASDAAVLELIIDQPVSHNFLDAESSEFVKLPQDNKLFLILNINKFQKELILNPDLDMDDSYKSFIHNLGDYSELILQLEAVGHNRIHVDGTLYYDESDKR